MLTQITQVPHTVQAHTEKEPTQTHRAARLWQHITLTLQKGSLILRPLISHDLIIRMQHKSKSIPQLCITKFLAAGVVGHVFSGVLTDGKNKHDVVAKWVQDATCQSLLHQEARAYSILQPLQGSFIPQMYGLFEINQDLLLVTGRIGDPLATFSDLSAD